MDQTTRLNRIATQISDLTPDEIARLSKLLVFSGDYNAAELLDHLGADFKQLEQELMA